MKKLIIISIALVLSSIVTAQQGKNFSLWFLNNAQHNPAAVGNINNDMKVFANFRYQYFTVTDKPFQTISASAEGKLFKSEKRFDFLGVGVSFINDMSGDGKYTVNNVTIPIAYHIYFNKNNSLSLGISTGIYQRSLSPGNLTWESQWNGYQFDQSTIPEIIPRTSLTNFDLGAGIFYKFQSSPTDKIYFGISAIHLLEPQLNFNIQDDLMRRFIGQFGMIHRFPNSNFGISPQVFVMIQGPNQNIIFGSNFDLYLQDASKKTIFIEPKMFSFGVYHRLRDAIIVNAQFSFSGVTIAASYDTNINNMRLYSKTVGGAELALMWDFMFNKKAKKLY